MGPVSSPQLVNLVFGATITAQDVNNQTVTNYTGMLALSSTADGGKTTNTILGNVITTGQGPTELYSRLCFYAKHQHHRDPCASLFGSKVSIWTDSGTLLATQNVISVPGTWVETPLATPI